MVANPQISVLVPTLNRHERLTNTLTDLLSQRDVDMEIIVCDQTAEHPPDTRQFLSSHSDRIQVHTAAPEGLVPAYRRCVQLAKAEICLFVDDDVQIRDRRFVAGHLARYSDSGVFAISGQILHDNQVALHAPPPKLGSRHGWRYVRFDMDRCVENMPSLAAGNMSFRRTLYDAVGGFDTSYRANGFRFETDFSFAIKKHGGDIRFDNRLSLTHLYGSAGGAGNRYLGSLSPEAEPWYVEFFANTWYFLLKWYPIPEAIYLMALIWREHAFNRSILRKPGLLAGRHRSLSRGLRAGYARWAAYKRRES